MKSSIASLVFSRLVVFSLTISLLCVQTMVATSLGSKGMAAEITVSGPRIDGEKPFVDVNGERALNGRTFFSGGTIATTETSSATLNLGKLGSITVSPSSSLTLSFSEGQITGSLLKGNAAVFNMDGVSVKIDTPHDSISNKAGAASQFSIGVIENQTVVAVATGTVHTVRGAAVVKQDDDDDDDDDDWKGWMTVGVIAAIIGGVVVIVALSGDDDEVSPVR